MAVSEDSLAASGPRDFATTRWSVVVAAQDRAAPQAQDALATLCRSYWYPLYAYIRRQGHHADIAQDLTQDFFARLLEKDFLALVDREKGRFRSFLLACCKHFLANERDRASALKRGGGQSVLSLDFHEAEQRYDLEPSHKLDADRLFERRWAMTLLDQVVTRLRDDYARTSRLKLFEALKIYLMGERGTPAYGQAAEQLGMSEGSFKVAVHRMRQRYRQLLQEEIARTVESPEQVQEEIRELFAALSG